jgi:hypothetical protein
MENNGEIWLIIKDSEIDTRNKKLVKLCTKGNSQSLQKSNLECGRDVCSPQMFLLVIDDVLRKSIEGKKRGIIWGRNEQLEDLVFADDVCLLSHRLTDMQEKIKNVEKIGKKVGLKIYETKTKAMRINTSKLINAKEVEYVDEYRYLGVVGTEEDVNCRIKMANATFVQVYGI